MIGVTRRSQREILDWVAIETTENQDKQLSARIVPEISGISNVFLCSEEIEAKRHKSNFQTHIHSWDKDPKTCLCLVLSFLAPKKDVTQSLNWPGGDCEPLLGCAKKRKQGQFSNSKPLQVNPSGGLTVNHPPLFGPDILETLLTKISPPNVGNVNVLCGVPKGLSNRADHFVDLVGLCLLKHRGS